MSRLYHVNAFSHHPFGGNPAVVVLGEARPDAELQAMAAEFNLSESAFLTQLGEGHYGLRWFTPHVEVDLCGHGTLAAAHVLWQTGEVSGELPIRFVTRSGELVARREGGVDLARFSAHCPGAPRAGPCLWDGSWLPAAAHTGGRGQVPA